MSTLVTRLIELAIQIGRWILEHAAKKGLARLIGYMDGKVDEFGRRLKRARTARRKRWLSGRIERWTAAVKWMIANGPRLGAEALAAVCKLPEVQRLPIVAACEAKP
jgi:hypothetical protein